MVKSIHIKTLKVKHGNVDCTCYVIDKKLAYISDVSEINKKDFKYLMNLKYLMLIAYGTEIIHHI